MPKYLLDLLRFAGVIRIRPISVESTKSNQQMDLTHSTQHGWRTAADLANDRVNDAIDKRRCDENDGRVEEIQGGDRQNERSQR